VDQARSTVFACWEAGLPLRARLAYYFACAARTAIALGSTSFSTLARQLWQPDPQLFRALVLSCMNH